jgi:methylmalonyl-CoA mutase N-terminal domain/subunit
MSTSKDLRYTTSGIPLKTVYGPEDIQGLDYGRDLADPGQYPFVRGLYPLMYRHQPWMKGMVSGFGLPEETNARQKQLLRDGQRAYGGQPMIHIAFDMPSHYGYDPDHPLAQGEVGKCGISLCSLRDMEMLLEGLPIEDLYCSLNADCSGHVILAMYVALAQKRGLPLERLSGVVNNGHLKGYMGDNMSRFPPRAALTMTVDAIRFCTQHMPNFLPVTVVAYNLRDAGMNAVQEVAFNMSMALEIVKAAVAQGLAVDDFAGNISWFFASHSNFFEEVCKLRAARKVWARLMRERFGARNPKTWRLKIWIQTSGSTLTRQEPLNNVARVALQALAAVLGGVQGLATCSYDEALALPTAQAQRVALHTQHIIEHETGVTDVADPLGGSYYVEWLTAEIERRVWELLERIEGMGGYLAALDNGFIPTEVANSALRYQREVEAGERIIVGVNRYASEAQVPVETFAPNPRVQEVAVERLRRLRAERDNEQVRQALDGLRAAAQAGQPMMPAMIEAARAYASLGEIMGVLREVFGEWDKKPVLASSGGQASPAPC